MSAYEAAQNGKQAIAEARTQPGSMNALIIAHYGSSQWRALSANTQKTYKNVLERMRAYCGDCRVAKLDRKAIRNIVESKSEAPTAANRILSLFSILMAHAMDLDWIESDPTQGVRKIKAKVKGFHSWTEEEVRRFEAKWPIGSTPRLALGLLLYSGQRRSDIVRMGPQHIKDGHLSVTQQKTGKALVLPVMPQLAEILKAAPKGNLAYLMTSFGKPYTAAGFGNAFREWCNAAGLSHCTSHGLRKAAARRLAESGASPHEIQVMPQSKSLRSIPARRIRSVLRMRRASA
jgi:integrase